MTQDQAKLKEIGEKKLVRELINQLRPTDRLLDGFGHDSGFVPLALSEDEILVLNTDRSGESLAYKLGLAGPEAVGDLAVSHAVSDIVASGGDPLFLTISLLLPENKTLEYAKRLMCGIQTAADRWDIVIVSGDTKKNASVAIVITVIGKAERSKRLTRTGAMAGDLLIVTGHLGTMFTAALAYQSGCRIPNRLERVLRKSLINQRPPFELARALASSGVAHACTDISDGLSSAVFDICQSSEVGAEIDLDRVPVDEKIEQFAASCLGIERESLIAANGDWQLLYAIPPGNFQKSQEIAASLDMCLSAIGVLTPDERITAVGKDGLRYEMKRLENDGFSQVSDRGYFGILANNPALLGDIIQEKSDGTGD